MKARQVLIAGSLLLASCSSGEGHPNPARSSASPRVPASQAAPTSIAASPLTEPLVVAQAPTPGTSLSLQHVPLAAGDGVSFGMHPSAAPVTLRATASMPLEVCHDLDPDRGGTGGAWPPEHPFRGCRRLGLGRWVQLPSTQTSTFHVAFRVIAQRAGTISSLEISYQRIDAFLIIEASTATLTGTHVTFTPKGQSVAASVYGLTPNSADQNTGPAGVVSVSQAGSSKERTGACTFPTEASVCFLGLAAGQPATAAVLDAPATPWLLLDLGLP